jgi:hydroxylamine dehydrogenase
MMYRVIVLYFLSLLFVSTVSADECVDCHVKATPNIVSDWQASKHSQQGITCPSCHGDLHKTDKDMEKARIPTPDVCASCHPTQARQFKAAKHALAWTAMKAMPTVHCNL